MHKLTVRNFGPINECSIEVNRFMTFIGPQSSGKSTLSKLIFFFLHVRDEVASFLLESIEKRRDQVDFNALTRRLRHRFVEFWGPVSQHKTLYIKYEYDERTSFIITLDSKKHRYVNPSFSNHAADKLRDVYESIGKNVNEHSSISPLFTSANAIAAERTRTLLTFELRRRCNKLFNCDKELLFIPAGRSVLSTLADQLQNIHPHLLDYPMRQFVERINATKVFFNKSLDNIIKERQVLSLSQPAPAWFSSVHKAQSIVRKVLKGEYKHDQEGGKLFFNDKVYTKINYASSGQQEAIWILLSLFIVILEQTQAIIFVEEPEAHLFPDAQKEILEFIAFTYNILNCNFVITTHSPYILSEINNLIYAYNVGGTLPEKVNSIISKEIWISPHDVGGYFVANGRVTDLFDAELSMLKTELVDSVSGSINEEYEQLFDLDRKRLIDERKAR